MRLTDGFQAVLLIPGILDWPWIGPGLYWVGPWLSWIVQEKKDGQNESESPMAAYSL